MHSSLVPLAVAFATATLVPSLARADQCALNDPAVAEAARRVLAQGTRVLELCEPCRDAAPGRPYEIRKVEVAGGRVYVNDKLQDLAYLYVDRGRGTFRNVGLEAKCGATDVSGYVYDGKPSGPVKAPRPPTPTGAGGLAGPPRGPLPPPLPPMPPVTSADDLLGTWTVRATVLTTTCASKAPPPSQTWTIRRDQGELLLTSSTSAMYRGVAKPRPRIIDFTFQPDTVRSGGSMKLVQGLRDRFFGTLVYSEPTGDPDDPACVVHLSLSGKRQP